MKKPVLRLKVYSVQLEQLFGWPQLNRKHRAVFMTTYAAGLRVSEVCQLRIRGQTEGRGQRPETPSPNFDLPSPICGLSPASCTRKKVSGCLLLSAN
jgi:hypothetical protein